MAPILSGDCFSLKMYSIVNPPRKIAKDCIEVVYS